MSISTESKASGVRQTYHYEMLTRRLGNKEVPVGGVECCHCGARGAITELEHAIGCPNRE